MITVKKIIKLYHWLNSWKYFDVNMHYVSSSIWRNFVNKSVTANIEATDNICFKNYFTWLFMYIAHNCFLTHTHPDKKDQEIQSVYLLIGSICNVQNFVVQILLSPTFKLKWKQCIVHNQTSSILTWQRSENIFFTLHWRLA